MKIQIFLSNKKTEIYIYTCKWKSFTGQQVLFSFAALLVHMVVPVHVVEAGLAICIAGMEGDLTGYSWIIGVAISTLPKNLAYFIHLPPTTSKLSACQFVLLTLCFVPSHCRTAYYYLIYGTHWKLTLLEKWNLGSSSNLNCLIKS